MSSVEKSRWKFFCDLWREGVWGKWIAAVWIAYGVFATIRDEVLPSTMQENYKLAKVTAFTLSIPLGWWVAASVSIACFWAFEAAFRLHNRSYVGLAAKERKIEELIEVLDARKPRLEARFEQIISAPSDSNNPNTPAVVAFISIYNTGTVPTILRDWGMDVEFGGSIFRLNLVEIGSITMPASVEKKIDVTYTVADFIHKKSATPIPPGGMITGLLLAVVQKKEASDFDKIFGMSGINYRVQFKDVQSISHEVKWTSHGVNQNLAGFGHMNPTVVESN